jgi:23S rRNA (uracil1939-C5)-methyltransferase
LAFRLSATSFFQVNPAQTLNLLGALKAIRPWGPGEQVLELYCGVGTLSLPLGKLGVRLHGVESHPGAVEDARANAAANQLAKLSFSVADAATAFQALPAGFSPTIVVMDPPRKGLDKAVVEAIIASPVTELAYVSCDPASLARDLKAFAAAGFELKKTVGVDLFPQTAHVESVSWLKRGGA